MKHLVVVSALVVLPFALVAQNENPSPNPNKELIRNGGFELVDKPVTTYDQLPYASGWTNANLGLCDLLVPTASPKTVGVPTNDYGTMKPFEGENYAGFFGWKDDVRRNFGSSDPKDLFVPGWNFYSEYPQVELIEPLEEDKVYELVFHVALSGNSDRAIKGIGAYPCPEPVKSNHRKFLEVFPEIEFEPMITEKEKWVEVRGEFKATGGEQYMVIGLFPYMGLESERIIEGHDNQYAYFYLDGVSLKLAVAKKE